MNPESLLPTEHPLIAQSLSFVKAEARFQLARIRLLDIPPEIRLARESMIWDKIVHIGDTNNAAIDVSLRNPHIDQLAALLMATWHDVARFKQCGLYGDYSDARTGFDHAQFGSEMFLANPIDTGQWGIDPSAIADAIHHHSSISYDGPNDHARLIRDIDKLALMRRYQHKWKAEVSHVAEGRISDGILPAFREKRLIHNGVVHTRADSMIRMAAWQFDINFPETMQLIREERLIPQILATVTSGAEYEELLSISMTFQDSFFSRNGKGEYPSSGSPLQ